MCKPHLFPKKLKSIRQGLLSSYPLASCLLKHSTVGGKSSDQVAQFGPSNSMLTFGAITNSWPKKRKPTGQIRSIRSSESGISDFVAGAIGRVPEKMTLTIQLLVSFNRGNPKNGSFNQPIPGLLVIPYRTSKSCRFLCG